MPGIMISYRRDDSRVITGRIFDRLVARYGRENVFRDIDSIRYGGDFRHRINEVLDRSDVMVAIVGPQWLQDRLNNETDMVRIEIETALRKHMPIVPVLVLDAKMPAVDQLPIQIRDFAYRNGLNIDADEDFDVHSGRLIRALDDILKAKAGGAPIRRGERRRLVIAGALAGAVVGAALTAAAIFLTRPSLPPDMAALVGAKEATEAHALSLQAELTVAQKKTTAAQAALDAAQEQVSDQAKRLSDLRAAADQDQKELANQKSLAADAQANVAKLQDQVNSLSDKQSKADKDKEGQQQLGSRLDAAQKQVDAQTAKLKDLQARADQAASDLTTEKTATSRVQAQLDQAMKDLADQKNAAAAASAQAATLQKQLVAETSLAAQLDGQVKALQPQASSPSKPSAAVNGTASKDAPQSADNLGPSFPCDDVQDPLKVMICGNPRLASGDLAYVQTYQAVLQQAVQEGRNVSDVKQAAINASADMRQQCSIPDTGAAPTDPAAVDCLERYLAGQRAQLLPKLHGVALEEASRPLVEHKALQAHLIALSYLAPDDKNDAVYGPKTRNAIMDWQSAHKRPENGLLGNDDAKVLASDATPKSP